MPKKPHGQIEPHVVENEVLILPPPHAPYDRENEEVGPNERQDQAVRGE